MPDTAMTAADFTRALDTLGLGATTLEGRAAAAEAFGSDERTVRRWRSGDRAIPGPAQVLVRLWLRVHADRNLPALVKARILPTRLEPARK